MPENNNIDEHMGPRLPLNLMPEESSGFIKANMLKRNKPPEKTTEQPELLSSQIQESVTSNVKAALPVSELYTVPQKRDLLSYKPKKTPNQPIQQEISAIEQKPIVPPKRKGFFKRSKDRITKAAKGVRGWFKRKKQPLVAATAGLASLVALSNVENSNKKFEITETLKVSDPNPDKTDKTKAETEAEKFMEDIYTSALNGAISGTSFKINEKQETRQALDLPNKASEADKTKAETEAEKFMKDIYASALNGSVNGTSFEPLIKDSELIGRNTTDGVKQMAQYFAEELNPRTLFDNTFDFLLENAKQASPQSGDGYIKFAKRNMRQFKNIEVDGKKATDWELAAIVHELYRRSIDGGLDFDTNEYKKMFLSHKYKTFLYYYLDNLEDFEMAVRMIRLKKDLENNVTRNATEAFIARYNESREKPESITSELLPDEELDSDWFADSSKTNVKSIIQDIDQEFSNSKDAAPYIDNEFCDLDIEDPIYENAAEIAEIMADIDFYLDDEGDDSELSMEDIAKGVEDNLPEIPTKDIFPLDDSVFEHSLEDILASNSHSNASEIAEIMADIDFYLDDEGDDIELSMENIAKGVEDNLPEIPQENIFPLDDSVFKHSLEDILASNSHSNASEIAAIKADIDFYLDDESDDIELTMENIAKGVEEHLPEIPQENIFPLDDSVFEHSLGDILASDSNSELPIISSYILSPYSEPHPVQKLKASPGLLARGWGGVKKLGKRFFGRKKRDESVYV